MFGKRKIEPKYILGRKKPLNVFVFLIFLLQPKTMGVVGTLSVRFFPYFLNLRCQIDKKNQDLQNFRIFPQSQKLSKKVHRGAQSKKGKIGRRKEFTFR